MYEHKRWEWTKGKIYRKLVYEGTDKSVLDTHRKLVVDDGNHEHYNNTLLIESAPLFMEAFNIYYDLRAAGRNPTLDERVVLNSAKSLMKQIKDLSKKSEKITAYKISLSNYCSRWMHAGITPSDVADTIKNEIEGHHGMLFGEQDDIKIEAYETTQDEIDSLGEFEGW